MEHVTFLVQPEQQALVELLRAYPALLKHDPDKKLPLKSGGTTDLYVNIREHRGAPQATERLVKMYANVLQRLDVDRFVEVPSSVSGIAGAVSMITGIPYATVRESEKGGRVSDAKLIGNIYAGERVAILDDVITDGASKLDAYGAIRTAGAVPILVVLVDRQQGWQQKFKEHDVEMDVWAGMTLHDIRKNLFVPGERADPKIIVALDGMDRARALELASTLQGMGCGLKVNDLLLKEGLAIAEDLAVYGQVMLDGKWLDISNTVENCCQHVLDMPARFRPWAVTAHASGGKKMLQVIANKLHPHGIKVLSVTVLTSLDDEDCRSIYGRGANAQVKRLASLVNDSDAGGIVCSPHEVGMVKRAYLDLFAVVPGVRSVGADVRDQKRVATPAQAIANGANALVSGSQIYKAPDPRAEVLRVMTEELGL